MRRFVDEDYLLGPGIGCDNTFTLSRPFLMRLMDKTKETVHLAVMDDDQVLYLEKVEGPHALRMPSRVGRHITTYCTSLGKAMLSCLEEREVKRIIQKQTFKAFTPHTIRSLIFFWLICGLYGKEDMRSTTKRSRLACADRSLDSRPHRENGWSHKRSRLVSPVNESENSIVRTASRGSSGSISEELGCEKQKMANAR
jgi:Bacterial transcriptional regulator